MPTGGETQRRASVPEILGAWLHLWTPPRDAVVPDVPWRKLALYGAGVLVVVGAFLAVLIPSIDHTKDRRAVDARVLAAHQLALHRQRVIHLQRPLHGADTAVKPAAGASPGDVQAARQDLLASVEASILADAKARAATGEIRPVQGPTTCKPTPATPVGGPIGTFDCFTTTRVIASTKKSVSGQIGYPFRAVVDFRTYTYAWCKTEQFPGEQLIPDPNTVVQLPAACRAPAA
jgi:hypothetical protein